MCFLFLHPKMTKEMLAHLLDVVPQIQGAQVSAIWVRRCITRDRLDNIYTSLLGANNDAIVLVPLRVFVSVMRCYLQANQPFGGCFVRDLHNANFVGLGQSRQYVRVPRAIVRVWKLSISGPYQGSVQKVVLLKWLLCLVIRLFQAA